MYICDSCNGTGIGEITTFSLHLCKKCKGVGKLNWLETIFGSEKNFKESDIIKIRENLKTGKIKVEEDIKRAWGLPK